MFNSSQLLFFVILMMYLFIYLFICFKARVYSDSLNSAVADYRVENASDFQGDVNRFIEYVQMTVSEGYTNHVFSSPLLSIKVHSIKCNNIIHDYA